MSPIWTGDHNYWICLDKQNCISLQKNSVNECSIIF